MPIKKFIHEVTDNNIILSQWASLFAGKTENNKIICENGIIYAYESDDFQLLIAKLKLDEPIEVERIINNKRSFYPVIFSDTLSFEPIGENKIKAIHQKSNLTGIFFSSTTDKVIYPSDIPFSLVIIRPTKSGLLKLVDEDSPFLIMFENDKPTLCYENFTHKIRMCYSEIIELVTTKVSEKEDSITRNLLHSYSWLMFSLFMQAFTLKKTEYKIENDYNKRVLMIKVKDIIMKNLSTRISMKELSKNIGMSPTYIRYYFKEVFGTTITTFQQHCRMEKAYFMLLEGKTVNEVAYSLGFSNVGHFSGLFKKFFGKSPKQIKP